MNECSTREPGVKRDDLHVAAFYFAGQLSIIHTFFASAVPCCVTRHSVKQTAHVITLASYAPCCNPLTCT